MSTDICERYAKAAAEWALQNPIAALYGDGPKAEKLARIWGEAIAKRLTENVRDEEMEQLRAERDALKAELDEARAAIERAAACWPQLHGLRILRAAPQRPEDARERPEHIDRHGRSWDIHPFVKSSRVGDDVAVCVCGESPEHQIHSPETSGDAK